jgi:hypothetical protein
MNQHRFLKRTVEIPIFNVAEIYHVPLDTMKKAVRECDCLLSHWVGKGRKPSRSDCKIFMMIDRSGAKPP